MKCTGLKDHCFGEFLYNAEGYAEHCHLHEDFFYLFFRLYHLKELLIRSTLASYVTKPWLTESKYTKSLKQVSLKVI